MARLSSNKIGTPPFEVCLTHRYALAYGCSPGFGSRLFPLVQIIIGGISRPAIVSTFHRRCWLNRRDGELAGFGEPDWGKELRVLGRRAFEKEIEFEIVGVGLVRTLAVMSEALPEGCFPILGEKAREAMNFSIVENLSAYGPDLLVDMPAKKRIFFGGSLIRIAKESPDR